MTLNGVMALILRYFTEFGSFVVTCQMVPLCYLKFVVKRYTYYYYYCQLIC